MPTVVIASPKGGAGKSTTSVLLATEMAHAGVDVCLFDCDPNESVTLWAKRGKLPERVKVLSQVSESDIVKSIKSNDQDGKLVVVDLEGVASRLVSRAITQADLVITPMRATTLDATIGVRALELIAEEEEALGRKIPHSVVFTMTRSIMSRQHRGIQQSLLSQGVDIIEPSLLERVAFSALFEFGGDLYSIKEQGNVEKARENAANFAKSVYQRLVGELS